LAQVRKHLATYVGWLIESVPPPTGARPWCGSTEGAVASGFNGKLLHHEYAVPRR